MGRRNNKKTNKPKVKIKSSIAAPVAVPASVIPPVEDKRNSFLKFWKQVTFAWKVIGIIIILGGALETCFSIIDHYKTPQEKHEDEKLAQGILETGKIEQPHFSPYSISDIPVNFNIPSYKENLPLIKGIYIDSLSSKKVVYIAINKTLFQCQVSHLKKGIELMGKAFSGCTDTKLSVGIINERLYVSAVFKDLKSEDVIGDIEYNHWTLYKPNLFKIKQEKKKLEVIDLQHQIVISVRYSKISSMVYITGYFIGLNNVMIVRNPIETDTTTSMGTIHTGTMQETICISKSTNDWKHQAEKYIDQIHSVF